MFFSNPSHMTYLWTIVVWINILVTCVMMNLKKFMTVRVVIPVHQAVLEKMSLISCSLHDTGQLHPCKLLGVISDEPSESSESNNFCFLYISLMYLDLKYVTLHSKLSWNNKTYVIINETALLLKYCLSFSTI
jgi:hypothetical protein